MPILESLKTPFSIQPTEVSKAKSSRFLYFHLAAVFMAAFFVIWFLYVRLPYDFSADIKNDLKILRSVSYSQLLSYLLNPLTPGWFFYGKMEELRPLIYLIHKICLDLFGMNLAPVHSFIALSHGLLAVTYFLAIYAISKRVWLAWFLVMLYASFPTNPVMLSNYTSLEIHFLQSVITLVSLAALAFASWSTSLSKIQRGFFIFLWVIFTGIEINWHSSGKLLPFVALAFLGLQIRTILGRIGRLWTGILFLTNLFMFLMVIPLPTGRDASSPLSKPAVSEQQQIDQHFQEKQNKLMRFSGNHILARTFGVPGEENPFLTVSLDKPPMSLTGDLGFFLGWFFWLGVIAAPFLGLRLRKRYLRDAEKNESFERGIHFSLLLGIWFCAVLASFGAGQSLTEVRHINFGLVPAIVILAFLFKLMEENFASSRLKQRMGAGFMIAMLSFTIFQNFGFVHKWMAHFGGIQHANYESSKLIYEKIKGSEPQGTQLHEEIRDLERRFVLVNWHDLKSNWFEDAKQRIQQEGRLFLKMRTEGTLPEHGRDYETLQRFSQEGYSIEPFATLFFFDAKPAFFKFQRGLSKLGWKRKKDWRMVLYQIRPPLRA